MRRSTPFPRLEDTVFKTSAFVRSATLPEGMVPLSSADARALDSRPEPDLLKSSSRCGRAARAQGDTGGARGPPAFRPHPRGQSRDRSPGRRGEHQPRRAHRHPGDRCDPGCGGSLSPGRDLRASPGSQSPLTDLHTGMDRSGGGRIESGVCQASPASSGRPRLEERRAARHQVAVQHLLDRLADAVGLVEHQRRVLPGVLVVGLGGDGLAELDDPLRRQRDRAERPQPGEELRLLGRIGRKQHVTWNCHSGHHS